MSSLFDFFDLLFFHKVVYKLTPVSLPTYLTFYQGNSRHRSCHLDSHCLVSSITPRTSTNRNILYKSFFYRTHFQWNRLPINIREIKEQYTFKKALSKHIWKNILADYAHEEYFSTDYEDDLPVDNG